MFFMELYLVNLNECPFIRELVLSKFHEMLLMCFCIFVLVLAKEKNGQFYFNPKNLFRKMFQSMKPNFLEATIETLGK